MVCVILGELALEKEKYLSVQRKKKWGWGASQRHWGRLMDLLLRVPGRLAHGTSLRAAIETL